MVTVTQDRPFAGEVEVELASKVGGDAMIAHGTKFQKEGNVGIVTVYPSNGGNGDGFDARLALEDIREKVQGDDSIKLVFITGDGNRAALLREIFEVDEKAASRLVRRMNRLKRRRRRRGTVLNDRRCSTHTAALLNR